MLPRLSPQEVPLPLGGQTVWKTSHLSTHSFFYNKHGESMLFLQLSLPHTDPISLPQTGAHFVHLMYQLLTVFCNQVEPWYGFSDVWMHNRCCKDQPHTQLWHSYCISGMSNNHPPLSKFMQEIRRPAFSIIFYIFKKYIAVLSLLQIIEWELAFAGSEHSSGRSNASHIL